MYLNMCAVKDVRTETSKILKASSECNQFIMVYMCNLTEKAIRLSCTCARFDKFDSRSFSVRLCIQSERKNVYGKIRQVWP